MTPFTKPVGDDASNAAGKLHGIMWKGQQIEALLIGIQSLTEYGNGNIDTMDTLAYIPQPMVNEVRELADELACEIAKRPKVIRGGAK